MEGPHPNKPFHKTQKAEVEANYCKSNKQYKTADYEE